MGFLGNLKTYARDAAAAKVDEAKAAAKNKSRDMIGSTSIGSAALGFIDKVNGVEEQDRLIIDGDSQQQVYIYLPEYLPPMKNGDRVFLEVREHGIPMTSASTGGVWDNNPGTYPVFYNGQQIGMLSSMHGFYEHAFRLGLQVFIAATCQGMYDERIPDLYLDGWSYNEWVQYFND